VFDFFLQHHEYAQIVLLFIDNEYRIVHAYWCKFYFRIMHHIVYRLKCSWAICKSYTRVLLMAWYGQPYELQDDIDAKCNLIAKTGLPFCVYCSWKIWLHRIFNIWSQTVSQVFDALSRFWRFWYGTHHLVKNPKHPIPSKVSESTWKHMNTIHTSHLQLWFRHRK